jgi:hypothetical protein
LCFLISSFCILLFYVSASVFCCCLKSFCDAYQNRNLNFCLALRSSFPTFPPSARSLKGEPRGTLTIIDSRSSNISRGLKKSSSMGGVKLHGKNCER